MGVLEWGHVKAGFQGYWIAFLGRDVCRVTIGSLTKRRLWP